MSAAGFSWPAPLAKRGPVVEQAGKRAVMFKSLTVPITVSAVADEESSYPYHGNWYYMKA